MIVIPLSGFRLSFKAARPPTVGLEGAGDDKRDPGGRIDLLHHDGGSGDSRIGVADFGTPIFAGRIEGTVM